MQVSPSANACRHLKTERPPEGGPVYVSKETNETGAGEEIRTLDPNLGKVMLYP
jgi:hypothetical protein